MLLFSTSQFSILRTIAMNGESTESFFLTNLHVNQSSMLIIF